MENIFILREIWHGLFHSDTTFKEYFQIGPLYHIASIQTERSKSSLVQLTFFFLIHVINVRPLYTIFAQEYI